MNCLIQYFSNRFRRCTTEIRSWTCRLCHKEKTHCSVVGRSILRRFATCNSDLSICFFFFKKKPFIFFILFFSHYCQKMLWCMYGLMSIRLFLQQRKIEQCCLLLDGKNSIFLTKIIKIKFYSLLFCCWCFFFLKKRYVDRQDPICRGTCPTHYTWDWFYLFFFTKTLNFIKNEKVGFQHGKIFMVMILLEKQ